VGLSDAFTRLSSKYACRSSSNTITALLHFRAVKTPRLISFLRNPMLVPRDEATSANRHARLFSLFVFTLWYLPDGKYTTKIKR
jgi:hypothetical protein